MILCKKYLFDKICMELLTMFYSCKSEIIRMRSVWTLTLLKNFLFHRLMNYMRTDKVLMNIFIGAERSNVQEIALKFMIKFLSFSWFFRRISRFTRFLNSFYLSSSIWLPLIPISCCSFSLYVFLFTIKFMALTKGSFSSI